MEHPKDQPLCFILDFQRFCIYICKYTDAINGILGHILYSPRMEHVHPTLNRYSSLRYVFFTSGARNSRMIGFAFENKTQTIGQDGLYRDFYKNTFSEGYHDWSINPPLNVSPGFNFRPY